MAETVRNFAKPFSIAGFFFGVAYMLYTFLAPNLKGSVVPADAMAMRILAGTVFMGPFGALVGGGVGLLVTGLVGLMKKAGADQPKSPDSSLPPA